MGFEKNKVRQFGLFVGMYNAILGCIALIFLFIYKDIAPLNKLVVLGFMGLGCLCVGLHLMNMFGNKEATK